MFPTAEPVAVVDGNQSEALLPTVAEPSVNDSLRDSSMLKTIWTSVDPKIIVFDPVNFVVFTVALASGCGVLDLWTAVLTSIISIAVKTLDLGNVDLSFAILALTCFAINLWWRERLNFVVTRKICAWCLLYCVWVQYLKLSLILHVSFVILVILALICFAIYLWRNNWDCPAFVWEMCRWILDNLVDFAFFRWILTYYLWVHYLKLRLTLLCVALVKTNWIDIQFGPSLLMVVRDFNSPVLDIRFSYLIIDGDRKFLEVQGLYVGDFFGRIFASPTPWIFAQNLKVDWARGHVDASGVIVDAIVNVPAVLVEWWGVLQRNQISIHVPTGRIHGELNHLISAYKKVMKVVWAIVDVVQLVRALIALVKRLFFKVDNADDGGEVTLNLARGSIKTELTIPVVKDFRTEVEMPACTAATPTELKVHLIKNVAWSYALSSLGFNKG